jgi:hypothetical protein
VFVFATDGGAPLTPIAFSRVVERTAIKADFRSRRTPTCCATLAGQAGQ